ncbi:hypothetical protein K440DRAFT_631171 [Wilcoxina mikolae CBS 423.85]|nr:hypothetical protein K440DRAFT_631171 [Wilcoxina mikolae CBS 423.85]
MSILPTDDPSRLYRLGGCPGPRSCQPCNTTLFLCGAGKISHLSSPSHLSNAITSGLFCADSQKSFFSRASFEVHQRRYHRAGEEYRCLSCGEDLASLCALRAHPMHHKHECKDCGVEFDNKEEYEAHEKTKRHRINATGKVRCVAFPRCQRGFTGKGAMVAHLESGTCVSGFTRGKIEEVVGGGEGGVLKLKGAGPKEILVQEQTVGSADVELMSEQDAGFTKVMIPEVLTTRPKMNPRNVCYICDKVFTSPGELRGHIEGLAHAPRIYKCPQKKKEFKSLSGLVMHLETRAGRRRGGRKVLEFVEAVGLARLVLN